MYRQLLAGHFMTMMFLQLATGTGCHACNNRTRSLNLQFQ